VKEGKKKMKKLFCVFVAVCMLFAMMAGCSKEEEQTTTGSAVTTKAEDTTPARDDLIICNPAVVNDLDPVNWYLGTQSNIFQNVYSTLVDVISKDATSVELRGNLASSWETENEGKTWVFHLNPNAVFSNGDAVTAAIVKNCFERHMTNPYTMSYVSMIESIDVRDEHTVAFNLLSPWASAPHCWYMVAIFHADLYDADKEGYCNAPVGSGPYELTDIDLAAGAFTLELKDEWWGEKKPTIKTVKIETITDTNTTIVALESGDIDFALASGTYLDTVMDIDRLTKKENVSIAGVQLFMNPEREALSNKLVRQAIAYAINYDLLTAAVTAGYASPLSTSVKFATLDYQVPAELVKYKYDPDMAKELLKQAGVTLPYNVGNIYGGTSNGAAEIVKQCLNEVGIEAEIVQLEGNTMAQAFMTGDYDIGITGSPGCVSAAEMLMTLYGSGQPYNFSRFSNARVDELIDVAMTTQDRAEYESAVTEALGIVVDECTAVGIGIASTYAVGNADLYFDPTWSCLDLIEAHW